MSSSNTNANTVKRLPDLLRLNRQNARKIRGISTGSFLLDRALGGEGLPKGEIIELFGPQASGKTTLALELVVSTQDLNGTAVYIDAEHAMDPSYGERLGVDLDRLLISQPEYGEEALNIAERLSRSNSVDLIVIDSVAALLPRSELLGRYEQSEDYSQANMMSRGLRKLSAYCDRTSTTVVCTNQLRTRINNRFGKPETTPGGKALKFYSSVRVKLLPTGGIKHKGDRIGTRLETRIVKNKTAQPFQETTLDLLYDRGICPYADLLNACLQYDVLEQQKSSFRFREEELGIGRAYLRNRLGSDEELRNQLISELGEAIRK